MSGTMSTLIITTPLVYDIHILDELAFLEYICIGVLGQHPQCGPHAQGQ